MKLIDQVNDEKFELDSKIEITILLSSAILTGIFMGTDVYNGSVGLMLILGLLLAKKVDVLDFKIYALLTISSMLIVSIFNQFYVFLNFLSIIITTMILLLAVIADEYLNEFMDSKSIKNWVFKRLATSRPILKIIVLILPLFDLFTYYNALFVLSLDITYHLTTYLTERKMKKEREEN